MGEQPPPSEALRSPVHSRTHIQRSPEEKQPVTAGQGVNQGDGAHHSRTPQLFGIELKGTKQYQFGVLATGSLVTAIAFSTLQERVFRIPEFSYGGWMTIVTYATFCFCAQLERVVMGEHSRNSSLKEYALVSVLMMAGLYLTNMSLNYLDYATRVIFKSSKVIPVMIFGVVVQKRRYSWQQYCAGILLVMGISSFTMGDKAIHPEFSPIGVALISLALVCDALTSNLEEKLFFRKETPCSEPEVILYTSGFGLIGALAVATSTGELSLAVSHSMQYQETVPYIFAFSCMGYLSVSFILNLIQHYNATSTEIVKSMRKVLQVIMSFVLYSKPINPKILLGGVMVTAAIYWFQRCAKSKQKTTTNEPLLPVKASDADATKPKLPA